MRQRLRINDNGGRYSCRMTDLTGLQFYTGLGRDYAIKLAKSAGAVKKCGRRTLYDLSLIDPVLDALPEQTERVNP